MIDLPKQIHKAEILVVDDNPANIDTLFGVLAKRGHNARVALNGTLALQTVAVAPPELILLDIMMPGIDGFEVCRRLKANPHTADIPVIFITALDELDKKLTGFQLGGVDYITKPFESEEVLARINNHLLLQRLRRYLQDENVRLRQLEDAAFEALIVHKQGRIMHVNQATGDLFGLSCDKFREHMIVEWIPTDYHEEVLAGMQADEEAVHEIEGLKADGSRFPIEIQGKAVMWSGEAVRVEALRDISWRKRAQSLEIRTRVLEYENVTLRASLSDRQHLGALVGTSPAMQRVYDQILNIAASDELVLITGETGTGKELAAHTIFQLTATHSATFIPVNCNAIAEYLAESWFFGHRKGAFTGADRDMPGYFEQARGGTLFLDEIGDLSLAMQGTLLRVLQEREFTPVGTVTSQKADVRILAASNLSPDEFRNPRRVREDFFHRIHVITLQMPPLRTHKDDIPLLIRHFFNQRRADDALPSALPASLLDCCLAYDWPGNVRELYNALRRYLVTGALALPGAAPDDSEGGAASFNTRVAAFERQLIADALAKTGGNQKAAAKQLRMPMATLRRKAQKYTLV